MKKIKGPTLKACAGLLKTSGTRKNCTGRLASNEDLLLAAEDQRMTREEQRQLTGEIRQAILELLNENAARK